MTQMLYGTPLYYKNYSLFIWNSHLTWCHVFLFAKPGNPTFKGRFSKKTAVCTSGWWQLGNRKHSRKSQLPKDEKMQVKHEEEMINAERMN